MSLENMSLSVLLVLARAGNLAAWNEFYRRMWPKIRAYAGSDDLAQGAFVHVGFLEFRSIGVFPAADAQFCELGELELVVGADSYPVWVCDEDAGKLQAVADTI